MRRPTPKPLSRRRGIEPYGTRDQMVEEATLLFSRRGYEGTSMRDIAGAIGILPGSLYAHIRTKEELLYEIVRRAADQFIAGLEAVRADVAPAEDKLRRGMRAHVSTIADNLEGARVFLHEWRALSGRRRAEARRLRDRYEGLWDEIVRELGPADPKFARLLVLSAANWSYTWYRPSGQLTPEAIADRMTDLLLDGLRGAGSGKIPARAGEKVTS